MYPEVKTVDVRDLIPGCVHFRWYEALWLPSWQVYCHPTEQEAMNIIRFATKVMEPIRTRLGKPFNIHNWLRPRVYNSDVEGSPQSWHTTGGAADFDIVTIKCDEGRKLILPWLGQYGCRMENKSGPWIHLDDKPVKAGQALFFMP